MQVALYFGSFNPIHLGHLTIAQTVLEQLKSIDQLWFVVSPHNPLKERGSLLAAESRLELVQLALSKEDNMVASDIEFDMPKPSYTLDTLKVLSNKYPNDTFSIVMGGDSFEGITQWKDYEVLLSNYDIILYKREGAVIDKKRSQRLQILDVPLINISSTEIRNRIAKSESIRYMVPDAVWHELKAKRYYH